MRALDRETIEERGIPGEVLMESAGRALVAPAIALRRSSARPEGPIVALCGAGNNGGDGFVAVRHLHAEGIPCAVLLVGDPQRLPTDAGLNWQRLAAVGAAHAVLENEAELSSQQAEQLAEQLTEASVVVDALFGTGLVRPLEGIMASVVAAVAEARAGGLRVLSVDVPSGISADTGGVLGTAIEADRTVTISLPKIGLALEPGRSHAGEVLVARVGIADPDPQRASRVLAWGPAAAAARLPDRPRVGHKGSFGHVLVIAGSAGKTGAAALSTRAAMRAGAGLVTLACPRTLEPVLEGLCLETMTAGVAATEAKGLARAAEKEILELAAARDVVALGPGLGREDETVELVRSLVARLERPLVVDADGLFALEGHLDALHDRAAPTVLTPHPGEAARLLGTTTTRLGDDRLAAARSLAAQSRAVVVLKGAGTVVAAPEGDVLVIPTGGPALASGGTGDVLTGVVAALLAARMDGFEAAGLAAWWHGFAADRIDAAGIGRGLLAGDLADALPEAAAAMRRGRQAGLAAQETGSREELSISFPGS